MIARAVALGTCLALAACEAPRTGATAPGPPGKRAEGPLATSLCQLGLSPVPMRRLATGHQVADVTLNGRPGVFVVDSGANISVLDARRAERFALRPDPTTGAYALGLGGGLRARAWRVETFAVGAIDTRQKRIMTADLGNMIAVLGQAGKQPIDGIVGQDVLRAHRGVIDVAGSTLFLAAGPPAAQPPTSQGC